MGKANTCTTKKDETSALGTAPLLKLIAKYSIPAVVASLINAIYNIVDKIFLSAFSDDENVLGGLQAGFPIMLFMLGVGLLCSIGFSTLSSIYLGRKEEKKANTIFTNGLVVVVVFTILLTVFGVLFIKPLLSVTGATPANIGYAQDYLLIIVYAQFFQMINLYLANYARIEGRPYLSMVSQIVAAVVNIVLDYIFIGVLGLGVKGAAYATIIGLFIGMMILVVFYFFTKKSRFKFTLRGLKPDFRLIASALAIGVSSFVMQIGNVVSTIAMNSALLKWGGETALNAISAMAAIFTIVFMPLIGIKDGVVPIIGYNYGAGKLERAKKTLLYALIIGTIIATFITIILEVWPQALLSMFIKPDSPTMPIAVIGMRINFIMLPLISVNIVGTAYLQSTKRTIAAFFTAVSRQILFLLPLSFLLPLAWGLTGVWFTYTVSDALSIVLALVLILYAFKSQKSTSSLLSPDSAPDILLGKLSTTLSPNGSTSAAVSEGSTNVTTLATVTPTLEVGHSAEIEVNTVMEDIPLTVDTFND